MNLKQILVAGNWKMNKTSQDVSEFFQSLASALPAPGSGVAVLVAPSYTLLNQAVAEAKHSGVMIAAQNCHPEPSGAYTGEVSLPMLLETGISAVIIGHSERRQYFNETDEVVAAKAKACLAAGLTPIICVGETQQERHQQRTEAVLSAQLAPIKAAVGQHLGDIVIAYEPVWAIGTGLSASAEEAQEAHAFIRRQMAGDRLEGKALRILYGGSVKGNGSAELFCQPDIDGGLVGGGSLVAADFAEIIAAAVEVAASF
jgi:triosephosphate isomerase (TIM)